MIIFASALAAFIPIACYLLIIWRLDKYDREPFTFVLLNFLWGAIGAIILAGAGSLLLEKQLARFISNAAYLELAGAVLIAPIVEETTKGIFLLITARSKKFDNITDGIVYGGAIGLGFGMTENFFYFTAFGTTVEDWIFLVVVRSAFSAVMHCLSTASLGGFIGLAKFGRPFTKLLYPAAGLFIAMAIHFIWNASVSFNVTALFGFLFIIASIAIFLSVFFFSLANEKKIITMELTEEIASNLVPAEHLPIILSGGRNRAGWIDESIRRKYVRALVTLAFRKKQVRQSTGSRQLLYSGEVENYRAQIRSLLNSNYPF